MRASHLAAVLGLCLPIAGPLSAQLDFQAAPIIGDAPTIPFAIADFNEDGLPDLVTGVQGGVGLSFLAGDGAGNFTLAQTSPLPYLGISAVGDFNNDGHLDLAAGSINDEVWVVLGDGAGGFEPTFMATYGPEPSSVAAGHFDDDGNLDLVVANNGDTSAADGYISVLLGDGDGNLVLLQEIFVGSSPYIFREVADFDGDGYPDVVGSSYRPQLGYPNIWSYILRGDGNGQFLPPEEIEGLVSPRVVADMDEDGNLDLIGVYNSQDKLTIAYGDGSGGFPTFTDYSTINHPNQVAATDLDGDGHQDLVLSAGNFLSATNTFQVMTGDGNGNFELLQQFSAEGGRSLLAGDWTGDGHADILTWTCALCLLRGEGNGLLMSAESISVGSTPTYMASGDFNEDGHEDLVYHTYQGTTLQLSTGPGLFEEVSLGYVISYAKKAIAVADFDQDQHLDLAITGNAIAVLFGDGTGAFSNIMSYPVIDTPYAILVADFNEDGFLDLANIAEGFYDPGTVAIYLGDGMGDFIIPAAGYETDFQGSRDGVLGDFDEDGHVDVAATNSNAGTVSVLLGNGDGTLGTAVHFEIEPYPWAIDTGDLNSDGHLDLVVTPDPYLGDRMLRLLFGDGNGAFSAPTELEFPGGAVDVAIEDFDDDGDLDIAVPHADFVLPDTCELTIFEGDGDGTFVPRGFVTGASPWSVVSADFDEDGRIDLATSDKGSDTISILYNSSQPLIEPELRRGDCNADAVIGLSDAIYGLNVLFTELGPAPCLDACDVNDDGTWGIADMVYLLNVLFVDGPDPAPPFPDCGTDPTPDALDCQSYAVCP